MIAPDLHARTHGTKGLGPSHGDKAKLITGAQASKSVGQSVIQSASLGTMLCLHEFCLDHKTSWKSVIRVYILLSCHRTPTRSARPGIYGPSGGIMGAVPGPECCDYTHTHTSFSKSVGFERLCKP